MLDDAEKYLTVGQFAKLIHYSERRIRQMIHCGKVEARKLPGSRKWLISSSELERLKDDIKEEVRAEVLSSPLKKETDVGITRGYDVERYDSSNRIMSGSDLKHLLVTLEHENSYAMGDLRKMIRWISFFNLKSNNYYDRETRESCLRLFDAITELIIFMKVEFAESRFESRYKLTHDDKIGKTEETLEHKKRQLEKHITDVQQSLKAYNSTVNDKLLG